MFKYINTILLVCFCISIFIGLPSFFMGCNLSVTNYCPNYKPFNGYIYKTIIKEKTCGKNRDKCWNVYTYASNSLYYNESTSSCKHELLSSSTSKSKVNKYLKKYYIGKPVFWYKRKTDDLCLSGREITDMWYTGVVFLLFSSSVLIIGLILTRLKPEKENIKYKNVMKNVEMI